MSEAEANNGVTAEPVITVLLADTGFDLRKLTTFRCIDCVGQQCLSTRLAWCSRCIGAYETSWVSKVLYMPRR